MRKLALLPLLTLALACDDSTVLQPDESLVPEIAVRRDAPKMIPLKGTGTGEFVVFGEPGCDTSRPAEETRYWAATGEMQVTHLGKTSFWYDECWEADYSAVYDQRLTLTGANGDQLVLLYNDACGAPPPEGYDFKCNFDVEGGTGRWDGATGYGFLLLVFEGLAFEQTLDAVVSAVGTIQ
jgi:hypothetical protein